MELWNKVISEPDNLMDEEIKLARQTGDLNEAINLIKTYPPTPAGFRSLLFDQNNNWSPLSQVIKSFIEANYPKELYKKMNIYTFINEIIANEDDQLLLFYKSLGYSLEGYMMEAIEQNNVASCRFLMSHSLTINGRGIIWAFHHNLEEVIDYCIKNLDKLHEPIQGIAFAAKADNLVEAGKKAILWAKEKGIKPGTEFLSRMDVFDPEIVNLVLDNWSLEDLGKIDFVHITEANANSYIALIKKGYKFTTKQIFRQYRMPKKLENILIEYDAINSFEPDWFNSGLIYVDEHYFWNLLLFLMDKGPINDIDLTKSMKYNLSPSGYLLVFNKFMEKNIQLGNLGSLITRDFILSFINLTRPTFFQHILSNRQPKHALEHFIDETLDTKIRDFIYAIKDSTNYQPIWEEIIERYLDDQLKNILAKISE